MELTNRLKEAYQLFPSTGVIMDIGADRGLLAKALSQSGRKVYASENKLGPFTALKNNTIFEQENYGLTCLYTDGIDILPKDVTILSLMGMGGGTIEKVLKRHPKKLKQIEYILMEPQSELSLPLSFLYENGFLDIRGKYILETRYYPLLLLQNTGEKKEHSLEEIQYGSYPLKQKDLLLKEYLEKEKRRLLSLKKEVFLRKEKEWNLIQKGLSHYE